MQKNRFVVVIVTYNRLNLLKDCIEHVCHQTIPITKIVIVNNHSDDGTQEYLAQFETDNRFCVIHLAENLGGAYGFYKGIECAVQYDCDWITLIDDDAILNYDFHEVINDRIQMENSKVLAYTGKVVTNGEVAKEHRALNRSTHFYRVKLLEDYEYDKDVINIDYASFCGIVIAKELIEKIGLPMYQLFIRCDDFEYCMRIRKYSPIVNVNGAVIDHRTVLSTKEKDLSWKLYYAIRNGIIISGIHFGKIAEYEMCLRYYLGFIKNILLYVVIKRRITVHELKDLYVPAIHDGIQHKLGKRVVSELNKPHVELPG